MNFHFKYPLLVAILVVLMAVLMIVWNQWHTLVTVALKTQQPTTSTNQLAEDVMKKSNQLAQEIMKKSNTDSTSIDILRNDKWLIQDEKIELWGSKVFGARIMLGFLVWRNPNTNLYYYSNPQFGDSGPTVFERRFGIYVSWTFKADKVVFDNNADNTKPTFWIEGTVSFGEKLLPFVFHIPVKAKLQYNAGDRSYTLFRSGRVIEDKCTEKLK